MNRIALATLLLSSASFLATGHSPASVELPDFPVPTEGITIPAREPDGWTLDELLREYARVTDQHLMITPDTSAMVKRTVLPLERELAVAPAELHSVVETLLVECGYVFSVRRSSGPRMLALEGLNSAARTNLRSRAPFVGVEDLVHWKDHPAYVVHTILHLPNTDVRTLTNSMRAMLTDANTQQIIPVGNSHSLILTGFAPAVHDLVRMLQRVDEHSAKRMAESQKTGDS